MHPIDALHFEARAATFERMKTLVKKHPQILRLQIEDTGKVPVAVYEALSGLGLLKDFSRFCRLIIDPGSVQLVSRHEPDPHSNAKLGAIFELNQLHRLSIDRMSVSEADFTPIRRFKNLETLVLAESGLRDEQLTHVGPLSNLKWLNLARTEVTDIGVKHLEKLQRLEYLSLWDNPGISDRCAHSLLELRSLQILEIMETEIGDDTLRVLATHPSLVQLDVSKTWISDEGLAALAKSESLKWLNVELTRVSQEGVDRLRRALPECRIETNPPEYMGLDRTWL